eukprot:TRINITY_DN5176_c0_g1_i1.p1 TRINITY_DN5176_c0_g1~~TRINITY_DN5176_c0_g1_i1.p1  ORF type:complete len:703 (+),score=128.90 TRINITY_DN5176_c0_g1_i1:171-2279(+)
MAASHANGAVGDQVPEEPASEAPAAANGAGPAPDAAANASEALSTAAAAAANESALASSPGPLQPGALAAGSSTLAGPDRDEPWLEGASMNIQYPVKNPLDLKHDRPGVGRLSGVVSQYDTVTGGGYVQSHMFEGELVFRKDRLMPEFQAHPLHQNEAVEFDVHQDEAGRPHAVAMKPVLGRKPQDVLGQRHRGYVRRFAERWGFLNAAAFDGDLFIHRDNLLPSPTDLESGQTLLRVGQAVEFDVALDDRNRCVAKQITTQALLRPGDWLGHRLRGYIRSFQGAWGFINSDRFAGDLFVHRDSLLSDPTDWQGQAHLAFGTVVEFDIEHDNHRKGTRNRLVARNVSILPGEQGAVPPPAGHHPGAPHPGHYPPMDPHAAAWGGVPMHPHQLPPPHGVVPPQPLYYGQAPPPGPGFPHDQAHMAAMGYGVPPPYPYPPAPYPYPGAPQPLPPPYGPGPYGAPMPCAAPPPYYGQPPAYGQPPYMYGGQPPLPQPQYGLPPQPTPMPQTAPAPMPGTAAAPQPAQQQQQQQQPQPQPVMAEAASAASAATTAATSATTAVAGGAVPVGSESQSQGLLHITIHDWEPDQAGQLLVTKGTLVNVSYRAAHGWVYAGTVQPGQESSEPTSEGWIPQAVVKRVSLCRVAVDWPAEGQATLGVNKGEIIAVSKEAERGWVYGERLGPRQPDKASDGWLPKKVLDYLQS